MMESFEGNKWSIENKKRNTRSVSPEERHYYEQLKVILPIIVTKLGHLAEDYAKMAKGRDAPKKLQDKEALGRPDKKSGKKRELKITWAGSFESADPSVQALTTQVAKRMKEEIGASTFETTWMYFCDGKTTRKHAFAALALGKSWIDLVFLAPDNAKLPSIVRHLKPFVLAHGSEHRFRIDSSNVEQAIRLASESRDHIRSLGLE